MKLKHILASTAAIAAALTIATTVYASTYSFAGFDQGFRSCKDENGNVKPGAENQRRQSRSHKIRTRYY